MLLSPKDGWGRIVGDSRNCESEFLRARRRYLYPQAAAVHGSQKGRDHSLDRLSALASALLRSFPSTKELRLGEGRRERPSSGERPDFGEARSPGRGTGRTHIRARTETPRARAGAAADRFHRVDEEPRGTGSRARAPKATRRHRPILLREETLSAAEEAEEEPSSADGAEVHPEGALDASEGGERKGGGVARRDKNGPTIGEGRAEGPPDIGCVREAGAEG